MGSDGDDDHENFDDGPKFIRLRGLPWSATHQEILDFLKNVNTTNGSKSIYLVTSRWDGKNTGEAYVELQSQSDVDEALKLDKEKMGHRYIEVFSSTAREAKEFTRKSGGPNQAFVVKLRGLPYSCTEQQIMEFFKGLEIKPDREGILFVMDRRGRATGEAFVQFDTLDDTEEALKRNREKIGHRYIEIFRSSMNELKRSTTGNFRPGPYDLKDRGGNRVNDFGGQQRNNNGGGGGMMRGNDWGSNNFGGSVPNISSGFSNGFGGANFGSNNNANFGNDDTGGRNYNGNFLNNSGNFGHNNGNFGHNNGSFMGNSNNNNGNSFTNNNSNNNRHILGLGDFNNFGNNNDNYNDNNDFNNRNNNSGNNNNNFGGGNFGPIGGRRQLDAMEYHAIHLRGMPYNCFEEAVYKFFDPVRPVNVRINYNQKGLHAGDADAFFETYEDSQLAMKRHRQQMGTRYIELFYDGKVKANVINGNNGGGNNGRVGVGGGNNFGRRF